jgi:hypothetical protein
MTRIERRCLVTGVLAAVLLAAAPTLALWRCWTAGKQRAEITGVLEMACLWDAGGGTLCEGLKAYREALAIRDRVAVPGRDAPSQ